MVIKEKIAEKRGIKLVCPRPNTVSSSAPAPINNTSEPLTGKSEDTPEAEDA
jgi:hypothetical protein